MSESARIQKLFADWYDGIPWTEIKMTDILKDVTPEMAATHYITGANSIWQLVYHCLGWRINVLQKIQGAEFASPADNYLSEPSDTDAAAWEKLLADYAQNEKDWQQYLATVSNDILDSGYIPSKTKFTCYEVIHGLLHHDNYHFGQIVMLKKLAQQSQ